MKKRILSILLICLGTSYIICAQHHTDHLYIVTDSIFNNPERGFYKYTSRESANGSLSKSTLENYYNDGYTLIYRIYYLQDYVDRPIADEYLDRIREDFQVIRESGIKVVLRFAYTSKSTPPYGDASPEQVMEHIAQLKPILQENADVIAVLQAGLIGAWGEWYYTDYFSTGSPDNITPEDLEERSDLVYSLLDALPASRQVQLRYVGYKMDFFGDEPITFNEAYSGNAKSRIAHHNDCFLSSNNDVGTYHSAYDRTYLKSDSKYTAVGGETCRWYEPRSNCDTTLVEMARYHWSFINIDYFGTTIQNWKDDGCFDDIQRKLGYRYQIMTSSIQDSSIQRGSFHGTVQIINTGFSSPYNPRAIELVMRNRSTKEEYFLEIETDIRKNQPGELFTLVFEGGIPADAENGTYDLFLNFPDPMISLKNDPCYSIRLANENVWEASTGYNKLFHTLIINPASSAPEFTGTDFFSNSEKRNMPIYEELFIDGKEDDWVKIAASYQSPLNQYAREVRVYNDNLFLYILVKGPALLPYSRFFIDSDNSSLTGINHPDWQTNGLDFMIENSVIFAYTGKNGTSVWSWQQIGQVDAVINDSVAEFAIPLSSLSITVDSIKFGYKNGTSNFTTSDNLPPKTDPVLVYIINGLIDQAPEILSTHYSNNAILYWGIRENDNKSRIIERSQGNGNNYNVITILSPGIIAYKDFKLTPGQTYFYRSYLTNFQTVTPYTPEISIIAGSEIFRYTEITPDGSTDDWNAIAPASGLFEAGTFALRLFTDTKNLNVLITGNGISGFELFLETDDNPVTGTNNQIWNSAGIDYKISHDSLFSYQQGWTYKTGLASYIPSGSVIELSIPFNEILLGDNATIRAGLVLNTERGVLYLPFHGKPMTIYNRFMPANLPSGFQLVASSEYPSSKIIIRWDKCTRCDGYIIEKMDVDKGVFEYLVELDYKAYQYIDDSLENHKEYSYRMYSYNPAGRSEYTRTLTGSTHDVGIPEMDANDRFRAYYDPVARSLDLRIIDLDMILISVALYDFSGKQIYTAQFRKGEHELILPVQGFKTGIYLLLLNFQTGQYTEKVLIY